jgi:hypothetical protein
VAPPAQAKGALHHFGNSLGSMSRHRRDVSIHVKSDVAEIDARENFHLQSHRIWQL